MEEAKYESRGHRLSASVISNAIEKRIGRNLTDDEFLAVMRYCRKGPFRDSLDPTHQWVHSRMAEVILRLRAVRTDQVPDAAGDSGGHSAA